MYADTGKRDPYFNAVFAGLHNPSNAGAVTNVLQISINKQNTQLVAVGNFTTVDGQSRVARSSSSTSATRPTAVDTDRAPDAVDLVRRPSSPQACSSAFDTYMTDVEYSPGRHLLRGLDDRCLRRQRQHHRHLRLRRRRPVRGQRRRADSPATWTAYTGGDTTWTVEVTDNVVYAGGHQRWQNNPDAPATRPARARSAARASPR